MTEAEPGRDYGFRASTSLQAFPYPASGPEASIQAILTTKSIRPHLHGTTQSHFPATAPHWALSFHRVIASHNRKRD